MDISQAREYLDYAKNCIVKGELTLEQQLSLKNQLRSIELLFPKHIDSLPTQHGVVSVGSLPKKKVFLAYPRAGAVEMESAFAAFTCCAQSQYGIFFGNHMTSSTTHCFNSLWVQFLNHDWDFDYFCLLHADVNPHGAWLECMIEELERHELDVLHAAVAIKDHQGLTSTAVGSYRETDRWQKVRRITLHELQQLPDTFVYDDVRGLMKGRVPADSCLLNNTGVLLVKVQPWVKRFPGFQWFNRVVDHRGMPVEQMREEPQGPFYAQFYPEDWEMGAWCARNGLSVGGTHKVRVHHIGRSIFANDITWGNEVDAMYFADL